MSAEERTLPASERRLEKARSEGHTPVSPEIASLVTGGWVLLGLAGLAGPLRDRMIELARDAWTFVPPATVQTPAEVTVAVPAGSSGVLAMAVGWGAGLAGLTVLAAIGQKGWTFHPARLAPDPTRFTAGWRAPEGDVVLGRLLLDGGRVILIGAALAAVFVGPLAPELGPGATPGVGLGFLGLGLLGPLVALDLVQRHLRFRRSLRMTAQEARDEAKEEEGDGFITGVLEGRARRNAGRGRSAACMVTDGTRGVLVTVFEDLDQTPEVAAQVEGEALEGLLTRQSETGMMILTCSILGSLGPRLQPMRPVPAELYPILIQAHERLFLTGRSTR